MQSEMQRFSDRFNALFANEGLENIKFFVHDADGCSFQTFLAEANAIQTAIAADEVVRVQNVDVGCRKKRFDEPF